MLRRWKWLGSIASVGAVSLAALSGSPASVSPRSAAASDPAPAVRSSLLPSPVASTAEGEPATLPLVTVRPELHPLAHLSARQIAELAIRSPEQLGSATVGRPNRGRLLNGVPLTTTEAIRVVVNASSYGTETTVRSIQSAVAEVLRSFPDTEPLPVGDLSRRGGGYLRPHRSHQTGVDADLAYYYSNGEPWYTKANAANLDRARTWTLLKALVSQGNVEYVFMDRSVQQLLIEYALESGESAELVATLFESKKNRTTPVRHARRHLTHFHVRFHDPIAEETGRRLLPSWKRLRRL